MSRPISEYLRMKRAPVIPEVQTQDFEEVPEDYDDGWTENDVKAAMQRLIQKLGVTDNVQYSKYDE